MTTKKFFNKYHGMILEDAGAYKSKEFEQFARDFRSVIKAEAESIGAKLVKFNVGHYDVSGFIEKDGRYVYFSYSEPRHMPIDLTRTDAMMGILVRKALDLKDYSGKGGYNRFANLYSFASELRSLLS